MIDNRKILKRIDNMEAMAKMLLQDATILREELGLFPVSTPRKGLEIKARAIEVVAKRNQRITQK